MWPQTTVMLYQARCYGISALQQTYQGWYRSIVW